MCAIVRVCVWCRVESNVLSRVSTAISDRSALVAGSVYRSAVPVATETASCYYSRRFHQTTFEECIILKSAALVSLCVVHICITNIIY